MTMIIVVMNPNNMVRVVRAEKRTNNVHLAEKYDDLLFNKYFEEIPYFITLILDIFVA